MKINPYAPPKRIKEKTAPPRTWTEEEIFETVAQCLVEVLWVDRDEITPQASLVLDLGAE